MTIFVTARYKDDDYGKMKWYGVKDGKEIFRSPTGRLYLVVDQGNMDSTQKVAFAAWKKDGFK